MSELGSQMNMGRAQLELGGPWAAAEADDELRRSFPRPELDDSGWAQATVPGHWRSESAFASSDGPLLYRRRFSWPPLLEGERAWLVMEGAFYQSDVWLDGSYLGDTEGYFFPHSFDITEALRARDAHVLAIEVGCDRPSRPSGKRALIGVWSDETCIDPSYNPGGIWAPVRIVTTGSVRISSLRFACPEASAGRALLQMSALLDASRPVQAAMWTEVRALTGGGNGSGTVVARDEKQHALAVGQNRVKWRLELPDPRLWWPAGLGDQPLYDVVVSVEVEGQQSDSRARRTGLRQVRASNFRFSVNGDNVFLKGANLLPTRRDLASATPEEVARDVELAREAGLNLLRAHAHIARPELYDAADVAGILIWQDMPLHGSYRGVRRQAVRQAAKAVELLGHHPSVVLWCSHNEPFPSGPPGPGWRPGRSLRRVAAQAVPNPRRSLLDQSVRRAFERSDGSRPVVSSSGVLPHLARATASHLYFGWYHGKATDLARAAKIWPALVRFISELGAQAVPPGPTPFAGGSDWPALAWDDMSRHYCLQPGVMGWHVPPERFSSFEAWRQSTQAYQADVVRCQVEALRRLSHRPAGGFAVHFLNDAQPAVSCSLLDEQRRPKLAFHALGAACADVIVVADWPASRYLAGQLVSLDVHVVNDSPEAVAGALVEARATWPGGGRAWRFAGASGPRSCSFVARLVCVLPEEAALRAAGPPETTEDGGKAWPLRLDLELRWGSPARSAINHYRSKIVGAV
ncbi:MAG TPA: hypothetical protein VK425_00445 [Acidimicrobiales bacterium]|nr:hypothetical protein [Acidimicrobiales bacterium]